MPLRFLMRYLLQNEQLTQKLAESRAMKAAARWTAYFYYKGKDFGEETIDKVQESQPAEKLKETTQRTKSRVQSFSRTLSQELQDGMKELNEKLKEQRKR